MARPLRPTRRVAPHGRALTILMPDPEFRILMLKAFTGGNLRLYGSQRGEYGDAVQSLAARQRARVDASGRPMARSLVDAACIGAFEHVRDEVLAGLDEFGSYLDELDAALDRRWEWKMFIGPVVAILILLFIDYFALIRPDDALTLPAVAIFIFVTLGGLLGSWHILGLQYTIWKTGRARRRIEDIAARVEARREVEMGEIEWVEKRRWSGVDWGVVGL